MNHFVKFITRILLACFFVCAAGLIVLALAGLGRYMVGWAWGTMVMMCYLLLLAVQSRQVKAGDVHAGVGKAKRQMAVRFMVVGALVALGLQVFDAEPMSLLLSVLLIQPVLYIVYWLMG